MAVTDIRPAAAGATSLGSDRGRIWKSLRRNPLGLAGGILLALVVLVALLAPLLAPYDPAQVHFATPFQKPGTVGFLLGTDDLGRDIFSRLVFGIRSSLEVGVLAVLLSVVIGTPLGLLAGYWRWLDAIISRLNDVTLAFPFLIIAVGLVAITGPSLGNAAVAIGIAHIPAMIRIIRGETLRIKESDFVIGAKTMDASGGRIIFQHILPNTASSLIVQATVIMPAAVIGEAVLSFLGLGIQPPAPSLGIMLSDAQQYLFRSPTAAIVPGLGIAAICLAFNLFGDALRDALDPAATTRKK
ncbi:peptide/nickel transport system permease protein [Arthrobacter oryzae]|uniref:ABC transporter permease n=1 Tax=Arthrobacter TaxID=1663 RepID=UPI001F47AD67|nr:MULTISPECIES: ABC transporter permease [Arthrobacter]MDP9986655.1 peptide/nickel transport system permease protein [Arthrobacter oryzae]UKA72303.1 ABC transporter permease [Arthrobacter sp. FW306-06-A]